ncbi:MAG TPA: relaxase/mobilization nuclease domain-containing protein [Puia sp.]|jgi:hypothetical protein|nr:relaxase/mobilization nuclease domain-containing protein [Puia sp.]
MHANLKLNPSAQDVVNYHEEKVEKKVAECIWAENFVKDHASLSYEEKLYPFELRAGYNDAVKKKMFHTSLLFGAAETISNEKMVAVAREYMQEMGWGDEPYLIYRHGDARRAHLHLVSTNINREGKVIGISRYALLRSAAVAEQLTWKYGLQNGEEMAATVAEAVQRLDKGLGYLYPVMNRIIEEVVPQYRYTDLGELNAVLRLHDIQVNRGKEGSLTYRRQGLHYHPLNAGGQPIKEYLPARRFPSRPTLASLEKRFAENRVLREQHREDLAVGIDFTLAGRNLSLEAFKEALTKRRVSVVTGEDKEAGNQIWFIDHGSKAVFEGARLGADYSFAGMQKRLVSEEAYQQQQQTEEQSHRLRHSF